MRSANFALSMKKLFVIILLLVYGASSSGMTLHFHYCCGKLDTIDLSPVKHKGCGMNPKPGKKACCDNKEVTLNIKSEQSLVKHIYPSFQVLAIKPTLPEFLVSSPVKAKGLLPQLFAPPPLQEDRTILFCVYRI